MRFSCFVLLLATSDAIAAGGSLARHPDETAEKLSALRGMRTLESDDGNAGDWPDITLHSFKAQGEFLSHVRITLNRNTTAIEDGNGDRQLSSCDGSWTHTSRNSVWEYGNSGVCNKCTKSSICEWYEGGAEEAVEEHIREECGVNAHCELDSSALAEGPDCFDICDDCWDGCDCEALCAGTCEYRLTCDTY